MSFIFFFSSRRRHTRCGRDWSSDVCSSDLDVFAYFHGHHEHDFLAPNPEGLPVWPLLFLTITCGAISGFHSTQSPMIARCLTNEKYARPIFYGAMMCEGMVACVWALAGIAAFPGGYPELKRSEERRV